eukprot:5093284-Lingulodinium_polyedra.AAC.1
MQCHVMPCIAMPCNAMQCHAPHCVCLPEMCICSSRVVKVAAASRCASVRAQASSAPPCPPFYQRPG